MAEGEGASASREGRQEGCKEEGMKCEAHLMLAGTTRKMECVLDRHGHLIAHCFPLKGEGLCIRWFGVGSSHWVEGDRHGVSQIAPDPANFRNREG